MSKHRYNGKATGTKLWIPPAQMGKKQLQREAAFLRRTSPLHIETCNFKPEGESIVISRRKKNGEPYMLRVVVGDNCGEPAISVKRDPETGAALRRCTAHVAEGPQI